MYVNCLRYELIQEDFEQDDNENIPHLFYQLVMLIKKAIQYKNNTLIQQERIDKLLYYYSIRMVNNVKQDQMLVLQSMKHYH